MFKDFFDMRFADNLGEGAFGYRHFIWIGLTILLSVALYFLFKKHKKAGRIFMISVASSIFVFRVLKQTFRAILGIEGVLNVFPWHMCTVLSFLMPIVIIFNIKPLKTAVYSLGIMGGVITLCFGDYFSSEFLTLFELEGMFTHSMLLILPLIDIALNKFSFNFKSSWQSVAGMLVLLAWATLANEVIFVGQNPNYMYLKENALPFEIPGIHFYVIYVAIYLVFFLAIFGIPELYRLIKNQKLKEVKV